MDLLGNYATAIYNQEWFLYSAAALVFVVLYTVYYFKFREPCFVIKGEYDISKKNLRNTPPPFPNGWYNIGKSKELKPEQVKPIDINGHNIVLFRGKDKIAYALEAYCLHMGANLGVGGQVVNEKCIECPFHGWLYDGKTGSCVGIFSLK